MNHLPIFHPQVEADVRSAMIDYDGRSPGLGGRFKRVFYETVDAILVFPLKDAVKLNGAIRTRLMRPFPYLIFYATEKATVYVLTVQYAGRRPAYLKATAHERRKR